MSAGNGWKMGAAALAALLALATGLPGCGGGKTGVGGVAPGKEDTLAKIRREGVLKWGADPSGGAPFVYFEKNNTEIVIGFEIDIMEKLATHMGLKHKMVPAQWEFLTDALLAKRSDLVMNGLEINEERKKKVTFSQPYFVYEQQLAVRAEDQDAYKSLDDLKGKVIGTLKDAEANNVLKRAGWTDNLLDQLGDSQTPYENLLLKRSEAVLQEDIITQYYVPLKPGLVIVPKTFSPGKYAVACRKEDASLLAEIDRALSVMKEKGELAEIYKKWKIMSNLQAEVGIK